MQSFDITAKDQSLISQRSTFSIDSAYHYIGGFGRFQAVALFCLIWLRNAGMYFVYGFGFLTLNQTYLCRSDPS
jgi:hypothetical protein